MSFSGRYPEHDICENFNAIDVREPQRTTRLRPGLCFIKVREALMELAEQLSSAAA